jgi:hypothetical protein
MSQLEIIENYTIVEIDCDQFDIIEVGTQGAPGVGIPTGGSIGQVIKKVSSADYDVSWQDDSGGGGGGGTNDHGSLAGLDDDDHEQYHNNTRGDARYYTKTQTNQLLDEKANTSHAHDIEDIAGLGALASLSSVNLDTQATGTLQADQFPELSGDVEATGGSLNLTIANNAVTNAKMATMANSTVKGNVSGSDASPSDLTATQLTALVNVFTNDLSGTAPASGGGTTNFLRADGEWAAPAGGGDGTVTTVSVATANGFAGSVETDSTTPEITITTSVNGMAKGDGTALSAATAGNDYVAPGTATVFTAQQNFGAQALTDAATITWNAATQQVAKVLLTSAVGATRVLGAPSNLVDGGTYILKVTQSSTGSNALTYNAVYKWPGGVAPVLSTANNAVDILTFYSDGTNMYGVAQKTFS